MTGGKKGRVTAKSSTQRKENGGLLCAEKKRIRIEDRKSPRNRSSKNLARLEFVSGHWQLGAKRNLPKTKNTNHKKREETEKHQKKTRGKHRVTSGGRGPDSGVSRLGGDHQNAEG